MLHLVVSAAIAVVGFGALIYIVFFASHFRGYSVAVLGAGLLAAIGMAGLIEAIQDVRRGTN